MAVLLLLIVFEPGRLMYAPAAVLAVLLGVSLVILQLVPEEVLAQWWFQAAFFVGDSLVATLTLRWMRPSGEVFLPYLLIVFGSALTRSARQRLTLAAIAMILYLMSGWHPGLGWPHRSDFWLRMIFLAVSAALMAVLARDSREAQDEQRRRYEERMVQVGRLATLGRVAGEVAHRIKGPLTTISVDAEVLAHRLSHDKAALKELAEIASEVERCKKILKDLLDLGRIEEMDITSLDLRDPIRESIKALSSQAKRRGVTLSSSGMELPLRVKGDASLLQEAMSALLQNALEAVSDGGAIRVSALRTGSVHRITVIDDGAGISQENLERIFEPFFTTKKGEGSGLGLSAALRIAAKHGGSVDAESAGPGRGSRFNLMVPAA